MLDQDWRDIGEILRKVLQYRMEATSTNIVEMWSVLNISHFGPVSV